MFLTEVLHLDADSDMVTGLLCTWIPNFGALS